ncbi:MAG TPA: VWA domain-containing protein [Candidatus Acidoferrales bacterium]|nr:VWA domain-containing protein [Candidatus Acidoferrales bacterium]
MTTKDASHRSRYFRPGVIVASLFALASSAQMLSPGEVRIRSGSYNPHEQILRAESHLVRIEVVVRDGRGHPILGLTKGDFAVFDSGRLREIAEFSVESNNRNEANASPTKTPNAPSVAPGEVSKAKRAATAERWIALFFDDFNTPTGDLGRAKIAAKRFIDEAEEEGDQIGVFTTSGGQILGFSNDASAILGAIANVQSHPHLSASGLKACPRITPYEAYQIVDDDLVTLKAKVVEACGCAGQDICDPNDVSKMTPSKVTNPMSSFSRELINDVKTQAQTTWDQTRVTSQATLDAIRAAVDDLGRMQGKRLLLFASSGFFSGDLDTQQDQIIDEALHANVVINSLDSKGLYAEAPGRPLNEPSETLSDLTMLYEARTLGDRLESEDAAMADFAESTGGLLFRNNNDLNFGFRELGLVPACAYELGFSPDEDGKYHKIKVEVSKAGHGFVEVRPGYFAPTKESQEARAPTAEEKIDEEVRGSEEKSDFPLSLGEQTRIANNGVHELSLQTRVDIHAMPFARQQDRRVDMLTFVAALFDAQGKMVTGKEAQMELALKPETFERFSRSGIDGGMSLEAPPGTYRLRVVVEEAMHGEMSAVSRDVQLQ